MEVCQSQRSVESSGAGLGLWPKPALEASSFGGGSSLQDQQTQIPAKKTVAPPDFATSLRWWELEISQKPYSWNVQQQIRIPDREARLLKDIHPEHFIKKGYGIATVYYGDIEPDFDQNGQYGVRSMFNFDGTRKADEWGAIGAWSWGLSRILDYLETDPAVDGEKVALSGVSRLGKTVLWAAAQDERFAMVIPMVSGEGGAAISRRNYGETVADLTNPVRYDYWFAPKYQEHAFNVDELPVDAHMLLSLIAPRPVLLVVGSTDTWSDPIGEWAAAKAAGPVYKLFGLKGVDGDENPTPGDRFLNDIGFFMHDGGHTVLPEDFKVMTDFMDLHFRK